MKKIRLSSFALLAVLIATGAHAALSKEYADWPKGPAQFLLTKEETAVWKTVQTDEEAKKFVDLFWARRDPTPATPLNEFKEGFDQRVKIADERFRGPGMAGSRTDQGKVFVLLGGPTRIRRSQQVAAPNILTPPTSRRSGDITPVADNTPKEIWEYEQAKMNIQLGSPMVVLGFIDQYGQKDWKLERQGKTDHQAIFEKVAASFVAQPDLREVPAFAATGTAAPVAAAATPAAPMLALPTEALRVAVDELRSGKATASPNVHVSYGEFITAEGEHFVPVQLYAASGIDPNTPVTFFGTVHKPTGEAVIAFEDPATTTQTTGGVFVARSLALPPGEYKGTFGVAVEGKPMSVVSAPIRVAGLDKDAAGISPLILSNHVYSLTEAQLPTDPFAFGGLKVVPKSDMAFRTTDELWYFFELRNPALDAATSKPKLMVKLTVTGKTTAGAPVKMAAPAEETPAQELKGVPGHWAVGQAMPLESFKPGEYTLAVKVTNTANNQSWDLQEKFRIVQ